MTADRPDEQDAQLENANAAETVQPANQDVLSAFFGDRADLPADFRCGFVAIAGRPNVGKSTLMNHLIGQKLSITSRKPQTTRHRLIGIDSDDTMQAIYVDTPGIHRREVRRINQMMNQAAIGALRDVDLILFVIDGLKWTEDDDLVLEKVKQAPCPVILVINKTDTLPNKAALLPRLEQLAQQFEFAALVPVSALRGHHLDVLRDTVKGFLPIQPPLYELTQITDRSGRFLAAERVREKIMRQLGDEIPYDLTVQIDSFREAPAVEVKGKIKPACVFIDATILVERDGQKAIVIGEKGQRLKQIGMEARQDLEQLFEQKVMLTLWVKVKGGWSDDERALKSLGYGEI